MRPFFVFSFVLAACLSQTANADDWPRWRGPAQDGHAHETNLPTKWSADDVKWKVELPGRGQSSPIVWGSRIFLTAEVNDGAERHVLCLNRVTGKVEWQEKAWEGSPEPSHVMNGWASSTCVTDGEHVYAFFGKGGGLFCYSVDGDLVWKKPLGEFTGPWGTAASPVLVDDLVIQNCDSDGDAFLVAFDKRSGKQVWKQDREDFRGWSTPILIRSGERDELVLNGHSGVRAYDPAAGTEYWYCKGFAGRGSPTVTLANSRLHVVNGLKGDVYAIQPGGNGNVSGTHRVWNTPRQCSRDLPSPIVIGDIMLVMDMRRAQLTAYRSEDGKELWRSRVGTQRSGQFSATPVAWDGIAFFPAESGEVFAIRASDDGMHLVANNTVGPGPDEIFRASVTPSNGELFIRSDRVLYCVAKK